MKFIYIKASKELSGLNPQDCLINIDHISDITSAKAGVLTVLKMSNGVVWIIRSSLGVFSTFLFHASQSEYLVCQPPKESLFYPYNPSPEIEEGTNGEA